MPHPLHIYCKLRRFLLLRRGRAKNNSSNLIFARANGSDGPGLGCDNQSEECDLFVGRGHFAESLFPGSMRV